jgi:hypothetical protein
MQLIGINGFMGSGKDTTYGFIAKHHRGALRVAFADKLKSIAALAIGFDPEIDTQGLVDLMNECKESWDFEVTKRLATMPGEQACMEVTHFTGRQYLQWLGANARVVFGDTFWIDQVLPQPYEVWKDHRKSIDNDRVLRERYPDTDLVVVTDVRYPNEAERVQQLGGRVWEVVRPGLTSDGHSSEIPLPRELVDTVIQNDGSLAELSATVKEALENG